MKNQSKMIDNVYCEISKREQINKIFEAAEKHEVKIKKFDLEYYKENKWIVPSYCLLKSKILDTHYIPIFKNEFNGMRHIAYSNFLHNLKLNFVQKYKIGDQVKIIANEAGHGFKIGEIVEIEQVYEKFLYCFNATNKWNVFFPDCKLYSKQEVKYKVGDSVKIIANEAKHWFKIGEIVEIEKIYEGSKTLYCFNATNKWNVLFSDCEPYSKQVAPDKQEVKPEAKPEPKATTTKELIKAMQEANKAYALAIHEKQKAQILWISQFNYLLLYLIRDME